VIHPVGPDQTGLDAPERLEEACGLARALDLEVVSAAVAPLRRISPQAFFGTGRVEALADEIAEAGAHLLVVDAALSPVQQRNLEKALNAKVVDRTGLILEIFARRAATREGKLQVELARLGYERSRLVRTWTHLERQRGGLGKTGGPGETQIELDRRLIADRIVKLGKELDDVRRTRGLQRRARSRAGLPTAALVGYTNAGKSTLFNRLTEAGVLAKDMLFATLDPTARKVRLPSGRSVVMTDTVGFITDLPTELVASFRATLEAILAADVVVHVRDIADPHSERQAQDVAAVLAQLSADGEPLPPLIEAWNKADKLPLAMVDARLARAEAQAQPTILCSALTGQGIEVLLNAIDAVAYGPVQVVSLSLDPADGKRRAEIAALAHIVDEAVGEDGLLHVRVEAPAARMGALEPYISAPGKLAAE
jgi:GTP-binding protein HflX